MNNNWPSQPVFSSGSVRRVCIVIGIALDFLLMLVLVAMFIAVPLRAHVDYVVRIEV